MTKETAALVEKIGIGIFFITLASFAVWVLWTFVSNIKTLKGEEALIMIHDKKEFGIGLALITVFFVALFAIFSPLFEGGKNTLDYLDGLFNSISKDSAYYIPGVAEKARKHDGHSRDAGIKAADDGQAARMEKLFTAAGATVAREGAKLSVSGDLGRMLGAALADADLMYKNEGDTVAGKYGYRGKARPLRLAPGAIVDDQGPQQAGKFKEAKTLRDVQTKAMEPAYNYYGVKAVPMSQACSGSRWRPGRLCPVYHLVRLRHSVPVRRLGPQAGTLKPLTPFTGARFRRACSSHVQFLERLFRPRPRLGAGGDPVRLPGALPQLPRPAHGQQQRAGTDVGGRGDARTRASPSAWPSCAAT